MDSEGDGFCGDHWGCGCCFPGIVCTRPPGHDGAHRGDTLNDWEDEGDLFTVVTWEEKVKGKDD